jgi:nitrogen regulatory protein P-II 1
MAGRVALRVRARAAKWKNIIYYNDTQSPAKGTPFMKKIEATIHQFKLDEGKTPRADVGAVGLTVTEVKGFGRQKGHSETSRGSEYKVDFLPKIKIEVVVDDTGLDAAMEAIMKAARTGKIGDGKMFITSLDTVVRIRTGEKGNTAL